MKNQLLILILFVCSCLRLYGMGIESVPNTLANDTTELQEITVTAIKQGVLDEEAVSATIVGAKELQRLNIVSMKGISDVVPNFYIPDYGSRMTSSVYVRGIGARIDQPAVGLTVDNVPMMNKDAYDFDLADIASIEMLRGPQSTLYGRNTMGGLININTLSPLSFQGIKLMAEYGSGNTFRASAGWYGRIREQSATAINAQIQSSSGFFTNNYNSRKCDHEKSVAMRAKYECSNTHGFRLSNTLSGSLLRQGGYPYMSVESEKIAYNDTCFYRRFLLNDGLTMKLNYHKVLLSSVTSVQYINDNMTLDQDFLPLDYFTLSQKRKEISFTQDLIASSKSKNPYSWLTGLFGFYKYTDMDAPVTFHDYGIQQLIEKNRNDANPYYPIKWDERSFVLGSSFSMPVYGIALYHQSKLELGKWHLSLGVRLDYECTALSYHSNCNTSYEIYKRIHDDKYEPYRNVPVLVDERDKLHRSFFEFLPKLSALYDLPIEESNANVFVSIAKGYKAGGYNTQMFSDVLQQRLMSQMGVGATYEVDDIVSYRPEKSWNFEIGFHGEFLAGALKSDASLFYIDCTDQQLTVFPEGSTTGRIMTNAGRTHSMGAEFSAVYRINDNLGSRFSYGFTDARFTNFYNGKKDYSGKRLPYVPQHTLFVGTDYTLPLKWKTGWNVMLDVNLRGTGPIYWNEDNTLSQRFYALLGASVILQMNHISLQVWGQNITDTNFNTFYFMSIGNEFVQRGLPSRFGVTLRVNI